MKTPEQQHIDALITQVDKVFQDAHCNVLDALNAVSVMSTSLAHSMGVTRQAYLDSIAHMFDQTKPPGEPLVMEEDENE